MPWSTISQDEVLAQFTPAERAALNSIQGAEPGADCALAGILTGVVRAARGSIAAGGNGLGAADTIPDQVREDVITLARWRWLVSFPGLRALLTKERREAAAGAELRLDKIAAGTVKVEVAPDADGSTVPTQRPSFGQRGVTLPERNFTDMTQDG